MELILAVLPSLAYLICPLMMVLCLFGMRKTGCASPRLEHQAASQLPTEREPPLQQLQTIRADLASLQPASGAPFRPPASARQGILQR